MSREGSKTYSVGYLWEKFPKGSSVLIAKKGSAWRWSSLLDATVGKRGEVFNHSSTWGVFVRAYGDTAGHWYDPDCLTPCTMWVEEPKKMVPIKIVVESYIPPELPTGITVWEMRKRFPLKSTVKVVKRISDITFKFWIDRMDETLGRTGIVIGHSFEGISVVFSFPDTARYLYPPGSLRLVDKAEVIMRPKVKKPYRPDEPEYKPRLSVEELERLIGPRGLADRYNSKRAKLAIWVRAKTGLPFKPHVWAIPTQHARDFYNDWTDSLLNSWVESLDLGTRGVTRTKIVEMDSDMGFSKTIIVNRPVTMEK